MDDDPSTTSLVTAPDADALSTAPSSAEPVALRHIWDDFSYVENLLDLSHLTRAPSRLTGRCPSPPLLQRRGSAGLPRPCAVRVSDFSELMSFGAREPPARHIAFPRTRASLDTPLARASLDKGREFDFIGIRRCNSLTVIEGAGGIIEEKKDTWISRRARRLRGPPKLSRCNSLHLPDRLPPPSPMRGPGFAYTRSLGSIHGMDTAGSECEDDDSGEEPSERGEGATTFAAEPDLGGFGARRKSFAIPDRFVRRLKVFRIFRRSGGNSGADRPWRRERFWRRRFYADL